MASGQSVPFFLDEGESTFVGWYAGDFNAVITATFAAYAQNVSDPANSIVQVGPLQVSVADLAYLDSNVFGPNLQYVLKWEVTNVNCGDGCPIVALYTITSQDTLPTYPYA